MLERFLRHHFTALFKHDLALVVHHVIVFENVLAHVEVARLNLLLGLFQRLVDPGVNNRFVLLQAKGRQHGIHAL